MNLAGISRTMSCKDGTEGRKFTLELDRTLGKWRILGKAWRAWLTSSERWNDESYKMVRNCRGSRVPSVTVMRLESDLILVDILMNLTEGREQGGSGYHQRFPHIVTFMSRSLNES